MMILIQNRDYLTKLPKATRAENEFYFWTTYLIEYVMCNREHCKLVWVEGRFLRKEIKKI